MNDENFDTLSSQERPGTAAEVVGDDCEPQFVVQRTLAALSQC